MTPMRKLFPLLVTLFSCAFLSAQSIYYKINIGTFVDARLEDFSNLSGLGFLHAYQVEGNLNQIRLGGYLDRAEAEQVLQQVRRAGYTNAQLEEQILGSGQIQTVIQVATLDAGKPIKWKRYAQLPDDLYAIINGPQIKLATGIYSSINDARERLDAIKELGFSDAFVKNVNSVFLHPIGNFETGNLIKKPLIPIEIDESAPKRQPATTSPPASRPTDYSTTGQTKKSPDTYSTVPAGNFGPATAPSAPTLPDIRGDIKRKSALELQKVLKSEQQYTGSLDGYYGPGTTQAYQQFIAGNREMQKYAVLSQYLPPVISASSPSDRLQQAINTLDTESQALRDIERFDHPLAKVYQAYLLFTNLGPSSEVNALMNNALQQAFTGKAAKKMPTFDYRATYAYNDIDQLVRHIYYVHAAIGDIYTAPCWLARRHPRETANVQAAFAEAGSDIAMQACDQFTEWAEIKTLQTIAADLSSNPEVSATKAAKAAAQRAQLYLGSTSVDADLQKELEKWDRTLLQSINIWASRDPLNQRIATALKVAYFQCQVRLEDYYMDQGKNAEDAKVLALATLQTLVGPYLERFI